MSYRSKSYYQRKPWGYNSNYTQDQGTRSVNTRPGYSRRSEYPKQAPREERYERPAYPETEIVLAAEDKSQASSEKANMWNSVFSLACLPGGFPICYAVGRCLVPGYSTWSRIWSKDAYRCAVDKLELEDPAALDSKPFSWGERLVNPRDLIDITDIRAMTFVWHFVVLNISPYPGIVEKFNSALTRAIKNLGEPQEAADAATAELTAAATEGRFPDNTEVLTQFLARVITTDTKLTPGELQQFYIEEGDHHRKGGLRNLYRMKVRELVGKDAEAPEEPAAEKVDFITDDDE